MFMALRTTTNTTATNTTMMITAKAMGETRNVPSLPLLLLLLLLLLRRRSSPPPSLLLLTWCHLFPWQFPQMMEFRRSSSREEESPTGSRREDIFNTQPLSTSRWEGSSSASSHNDGRIVIITTTSCSSGTNDSTERGSIIVP